MDRTARGIGAGLLLVGTALHAGCGNSASGLTTSSTDAPAVTSQDPMARPIQVAWTSARAQRCGFYFDPAKLKASYIGYETRQGAGGEQLGKIQNAYDTTFKSISARVSADPDYCTDKKGTEIKADLQRHLAGDFTPNLPKAKPVDTGCGFFGCSTASSNPDEKFDAKKMFEDLQRKQTGTSH